MGDPAFRVIIRGLPRERRDDGPALVARVEVRLRGSPRRAGEPAADELLQAIGIEAAHYFAKPNAVPPPCDNLVVSLLEAFRAALAPARRDAIGPDGEAALAIVIAAARATWPAIAVDDAALAAFVGERLPDGDVAAALRAAPIADLLLACGCARGDSAALAAFEGVLAEVDAAGRTARAEPDLVDEIKQRLRAQLLVAAPDRPAGIAGYRGRGSLRGWVRVAATRELVRLEQAQRRALPLEAAVLDEPAGDPALDALKARYRVELAAALERAIARLSTDDRTLLRHHLIDRLSIDELGSRYGVHRATAARWLVRARTALVEATQTELAVGLRLAPDEVTSVIRMVSSKIDASLGALAADETQEA